MANLIGAVPSSSIRSYLQLNTPALFARMDRGQYVLSGFEARTVRAPSSPAVADDEFERGKARMVMADCCEWLDRQPANSFHAVVTDPPYGLIEYSDAEQEKLRSGRGGVWRIPPGFDGAQRSPLPRFTVLKLAELQALERFFLAWARST